MAKEILISKIDGLRLLSSISTWGNEVSLPGGITLQLICRNRSEYNRLLNCADRELCSYHGGVASDERDSNTL
jgi:hypothetical protein